MNYLESIAAAIRSEIPDGVLPAAEDIGALLLSYAVLLLAKGATVTAEDVHNAWAAWMTSRGVNHESLVPFSELDPQTKAEDGPFVLAIRAAALRLGH